MKKPQFKQTCEYCYTEFFSDKHRRYCSDTCIKLEQRDHDDFEELKEDGFYSNSVDNLSFA
jgi:hypothetical protein